MLPLTVVLGAFAGLSDLLGSALVLGGRQAASRWSDFLLPLGTGFVLAIALAELVPAGLKGGPGNAVWILVGFATLYVITQVFESEADETAEGKGMTAGLGLTILGVALCDFFDGLAVASAVASAVAGGAAEEVAAAAETTFLGWLLLVGLFPHNFLEGAGIALVLLGAGMARRAVWVAVVLLATASVLGGLAVQFVVDPAVVMAVQAFAGGLLLHLVASQRIPAFSGAHARAQAGLVVAGIAMFIGTDMLIELMGIEA